MDTEEIIMNSLIGLLVICLVLVIALTPFALHWSSQCLQFGYPETLFVPFKVYCVRFVDATQEVVPLSILLGK